MRNDPVAPVGTPARVDVGAHTNLPIWQAEPPALPARARVVLLVDEARAGVSPEWRAAAERVLPFTAGLTESSARALVADAVAGARIGVRFAVLGEEVDVLLLAALLREAGALRSEIIAHAVDTSRLRVRCAHCRAMTVATARPGTQVRCSGCGLPLYIHHHVSRRLAAYLGFRADAEFPITEEDAA